jgi:oligopeptide/dipeptide ABC transporter ATP-binding protein
MTEALLQVRDLAVRFSTPDGPVQAVSQLGFDVAAGETLGIVGESGSGKSQTVLALMGLLAANGFATGNARFQGNELLGLSPERLRAIRGAQIAMIFQDPMTSLNPYLTIGEQMSMVSRYHQRISRTAAQELCAEMLAAVRITEPRRRLGMYPHELSGGMRQRVMIATALLCRPSLLIADEPTTALDVTVQAQILELMRELRRDFDTSIILITHDLGVVAGTCDRVLVMQDGVMRECGDLDRVFYEPQHPYTRQLLAAVPRLDHAPAPRSPAAAADTLLDVDSISVEFRIPGRGLLQPAARLRAVDRVSFALASGETLGVVGESGCGKSTLARAVLQLVDIAHGQVCLLGRSLTGLDRRALHQARRDMQIIFQDPLASLNPRMTIHDIVAEPLETFVRDLDAAEVTRQVERVLVRVGLERSHINRYPHEFSGGQCQRIGIARALILEPRLIVCDEPVSALDVSIQAKILRLLLDIQQDIGVALIFIAHDLAVVRQISHRVLVMYLGNAVEVADPRQLYEQPRHPYTRALLDAVPVPDPRVERSRPKALLEGDVPSPLDPPSGCAFRSRCAHATDLCAAEVPLLRRVAGSLVACHHVERI